MIETNDTIYVSHSQWEIVQWLFHYPKIYLCWTDMLDTHIYWSASWANEEARQHMIKTMDVVGHYFGVTNAREISKPRMQPKGGTPRCCFQTFRVLLREKIISKFDNRGYYQLNPCVRKQLECDELELLYEKTK